MQQRDMSAVRLVGGIAAGIGATMLILTGLATLVLVLNTSATDLESFLRGIATAMLALLMSSTLVSCGSVLMRVRRVSSTDAEAIRLNWTALFVVMVVGAIINLWLMPILSVIGASVALALLLIRGSVIRLIH